jgi:hypothetical protein
MTDRKMYLGRKVAVRYSDNSEYPAILVREINAEEWIARRDPPDPNLPPTYRAHIDDIRRGGILEVNVDKRLPGCDQKCYDRNPVI